MKNIARKLGSTLMEVNLALLIMGGGVLTLCSLFPLGYRESAQSRDDVTSAVAADAVLNQVTAALSSRDITWQEWRNGVEKAVNETGQKRGGGWLAYCDQQGNGYTPKKKGQLNSKAQSVFKALTQVYKGSGNPTWPVDSSMACALVAQWGRTPVMSQPASGSKPAVVQQRIDKSRVAVSFRCTRRAGALFAAPIYYTEIHFQGDQKELQ